MNLSDQDQAPKPLRWTTTIDEDGAFTLPDEALEVLGWKEDDELEFTVEENGSFLISKVTDT